MGYSSTSGCTYCEVWVPREVSPITTGIIVRNYDGWDNSAPKSMNIRAFLNGSNFFERNYGRPSNHPDTSWWNYQWMAQNQFASELQNATNSGGYMWSVGDLLHIDSYTALLQLRQYRWY